MITAPDNLAEMGANSAKAKRLQQHHIDHFCRLVCAKLRAEFDTTKRGWQREAAPAIGVSQPLISEIWNHEKNPVRGLSVDTLLTFADWLKVGADVALGRTTAPAPLSREEVLVLIAASREHDSPMPPSATGEFVRRRRPSPTPDRKKTK